MSFALIYDRPVDGPDRMAARRILVSAEDPEYLARLNSEPIRIK
jgi:hypothetical protein